VSHKVILDKYLVVGGIGGELVIVDLISGKVCCTFSIILLLALMRLCSQVLRTCKLPGTWTNNLALHVWQGHPRLIVCSNSFLEAIQGALAQPPFEFHRADRPTANSIFISRYEGALAQVGVRPNARP
jgi:hypothetical protein